MTQTIIHIRQISRDGTPDIATLCDVRVNRGTRILNCFSYQVKHAVYSGADVCEDCRHFYETHRDHFDNLTPPWPPEEAAMAFGGD